MVKLLFELNLEIKQKKKKKFVKMFDRSHFCPTERRKGLGFQVEMDSSSALFLSSLLSSS